MSTHRHLRRAGVQNWEDHKPRQRRKEKLATRRDTREELTMITPQEAKAKQKESRPESLPETRSGLSVARQQEELLKKCEEACEKWKGIPMVVATTGYGKQACDYVRDELENAGWTVEKGKRDGEFCFIINCWR